MLKTLHRTCLFLIVLWSIVLLPGHALAQTASLACDEGAPVPGTQLYDTGGPANDEGFCEFRGYYHIFSQVICDFVVVMNSVLSSVYCGIQYTLEWIIGLVITVYIAVYGVQLLMGMSFINAKDFMTRLLKIAFSWTFITQSTWAIGWAFYFFIMLSASGVYWVMSAVNIEGGLDGIFDTGSVCYDEDAAAVTGFMSAFIRLDYIICSAVLGPITGADEKVIGLFAALFVVLPPVTILALYWIGINLKIMMRGLITFLLGISALAFLIAMAPIFLSMMLFQTTYRFFETWLRYMISFSLQIILIFAVIAMWIMATLYFVSFFNEVANTIYPNPNIKAMSQAQSPANTWGICPFTYYGDDPFSDPGDPDYLPGPYVECNFAGEIFPVSALLMDTDDGMAPVCYNDDTGENDCTRYIYYLIYHLVTLIIVCYAFEALMRQAPMIAVYLAGPEYTPMLGQGFGVTRYGQFRALPYSTTSPKSWFFNSNKSSGGGAGGSAPQGTGKAQQTFREQMERLLGGGTR